MFPCTTSTKFPASCNVLHLLLLSFGLFQVVRTYMSDHGDCEEHISGWQEWDGGLQFAITYKNKLASEMDGWEVTNPLNL